MNRDPASQRSSRSVVFLLSAAAGGVLQWYAAGWDRMLYGILVLLVYALIAKVLRPEADEDLADAPYFLGFLFTVTLLAIAFLQLDSRRDEATLAIVLRTVGQGLILTALGLALRQVAELQSSPQQLDGIQPGHPQEPPPLAPTGSITPSAAEADVVTAAAEGRREMVGAVTKLRAAVRGMDSAVVRLAEQVGLVREQGDALVTETAKMRGHAAAAAEHLAQDLTDASGTLAGRIKGLLDSTLSSQEEVQKKLDSLRGEIITASAAASAEHAKDIDLLTRTSQRAQELAAAVTRETSEAAEGLRKVLALIPDPGTPMQQYADALGDAATLIGTGAGQVKASTDAVDNQLQVLLRAASNLGGQTESTVGSAQQALKAISDTIGSLQAMEKEYVTLVEDLHSRVRREAS